MVFRSDYTKSTLNPGILSGAIRIPTPWPGETRIVLGSPGYFFTDPGSNMTMSTSGYATTYPLTPIDWDRLITVVWWTERSTDGMTITSGGVFAPNISANTSNMTIASIGSFIEYTLASSNTSNMTMASKGTIYTEPEYSNWLSWSDVGSLEFTVDRRNVAGKMPMDWPGYIYGIKKLNNKVIVYGANGVSIITPQGNMMGLNTINRVGLLGRDAFAGNDFAHYFIDALGSLYRFGEQLELLDYKEYLSDMDPVLTLDESTDLLYICDGSTGYIYSHDTRSLGKEPPNVTGIGYTNGTLYPVAPADISTPTFEICTDILDFGTRKTKTVYAVNFGTDLSGTLTAAVDYRIDYNSGFTTTSWSNVNQKGSARITCKGVEFKVRAKLAAYEYFELDNISVEMKVHEH